MGAIHPPTPVKLICGMLSGDESLLASAEGMLSREFGPIDVCGDIIPFRWTNYYRDEMGDDLLRQFLSFERLIPPDEIAAIKIRTNALEEELKDRNPEAGSRRPEQPRPALLHGTLPQFRTVAAQERQLPQPRAAVPREVTPRPRAVPRAINLDPGYVTESKLVLASAKGLSHRIYLARGVFAEVTLNYTHSQWQSNPWTFPDYASGAYDAFLTEVRSILRGQLGRKERKA